MTLVAEKSLTLVHFCELNEREDKREMIDKMRESHRHFPALKVANLDPIC